MARLEDILAVPGNEAVYQRLKAMLADGSAIAFIGAGASFPIYPLWDRLIAQLAHEPVSRGLATADDEQYWLRTAKTKPLQAASQIHAKLTDSLYYTFLYETFKDRTGPDGLSYTPAHAALARTAFKALITTNYDGGLLEARRRLRPDIGETGFTVWNQPWQIQRWSGGEAFQSCPVLFAHGHFADPENIILDSPSYRRAYHGTPYRRLFENLWFQQHLVFVGFSFNDVILTQIADDVLAETARPAGAAPRHVAIIGLSDDNPYTPEMRREHLESYHAEVLFYPITGTSDHSALQVLLDSLATIPVPVPAPAPGPVRDVPVLFVHETTEDEKFTGRKDALARLDRWAADPAVKLVAITAIGGLGKTALAGRWLRTGAHHRDAVFFWSFYRDRDTREFFESLLKFGREQLRCNAAAPLDLLASRHLVVVLDGLEVIQEVPGTVAYGKLLDINLAEFLHAHCRGLGTSLVVLTSRYPFPDLTPYLGSALRSLPLHDLEPEEGAALLLSLGIGGRPEDREEISGNLSGHPLALRLFARSMPPELGGNPTRLWTRIFDQPHLAPADSLDAKMAHLLTFYEERLPETHRQALGLLALFRAPVAESALAPLWEKLLGKPAGDGSLHVALDTLRREHLLTADPGPDGEPRYACHPILRDHFRAGLLRLPTFSREAAGLLAGPPDAPQARSLEEAQAVATAIELLLEVGEFKAADDLYRARLDNGRLFKWLPALHWGMEVARWFVRDDVRRRAVEEQLGAYRLGFYLNDVGLWANYAGEPETALAFNSESEAVTRGEDDKRNLGAVLQNLGGTQVSLGLLADAARHFSEALDLATALDDQEDIRNSRVSVAYAASLRGDVARADLEFSRANAIENRIHPEKADLYSHRGIQWAEHLLRTAAEDRARELTQANRRICERNSWQQTVAWCEWILGRLDTLAGNWPKARAHLGCAKATFTAGHMILELARTLVTESLCWLGEGRHDAALVACERALDLAAPRNYRLVHADALNLRARIALERPDPDPSAARDDAEAALGLAEFCEYAWAQRDALEILARAYRKLGSETEAQRYATRAADWNRRLTRA